MVLYITSGFIRLGTAELDVLYVTLAVNVRLLLTLWQLLDLIFRISIEYSLISLYVHNFQCAGLIKPLLGGLR